MQDMNSCSVQLDIPPPTYDEVMNADSNPPNSGTLLGNVDIKTIEETEEEKRRRLENTAITEQPLPSAPPAPTIVPVAPGEAPSNNQPSAPYIYANDPGWDWLFWCFICQNHSQTQPLNNAHEGCCTASNDQCCCGDCCDCASCNDGDNCCENDDCGCGDCCAAFGDFDCDF